MTKQNAGATFATAVAENVRARAAARQVSQKQIAETLGLSENAVSRRMRGGHPFSLSEIERIGNLLGCSPDDLTRIGA